MGEAYENKGQLDRALEFYNKAVALNPSYVRAHINRGDIYGKKGDRDRAIAAYRKALEIDPTSTGARSALEKLGVAP
jgi:tetratricopeptide (TPR) repeat protein